MRKITYAALTMVVMACVSPAYANFGGTHTDTQTQHRTVTRERNQTRTRTENRLARRSRHRVRIMAGNIHV